MSGQLLDFDRKAKPPQMVDHECEYHRDLERAYGLPCFKHCRTNFVDVLLSVDPLTFSCAVAHGWQIETEGKMDVS